MPMREFCVYCGKTIEKESREHIIQNALGGLYESTDICCNTCNNSIISKEIDAPFIKIFNPIISRIENLQKKITRSQNHLAEEEQNMKMKYMMLLSKKVKW